ncbi:MAG: protein kinase [Deltaproteobacteria bacterium]|nr:protein kinase [Deltaproteobacteria bacterium]
MEQADTIHPGTRLGPYTITHLLGRGGTAAVYRGEDDEGGGFAIKTRTRGVSALDRRFLREFESMRTLRIPGVVQVFEAGIQGNVLWFSMELIEGQIFSDVVQAEPNQERRIARAVELGGQLLLVLAALHKAGFVHRDIKPQNIMVDYQHRIRVMDFGIARFFEDQSGTLSQTGEVLGTLPYMAPEQISGLPTDERVDLFAAGLVLYEAIAGRRPRPRNTLAWIPRICLHRLPPLATQYRDVPLGYSALVERLTAAIPEERPSAAEAARILAGVAAGAPCHEWPEANFVEPGPGWEDLERCIPQTGEVTHWILNGPSGAGKARMAEQLHRQAVMQGVWPIHARCDTQALGSPLIQILARLLSNFEDLELRDVLGGDGPLLGRMWPTLPLPPHEPLTGPRPGLVEVARAASRVVIRAARRRPLFLIIHGLENVDSVSARTIAYLVRERAAPFGVLLLHNQRWQSRLSETMIRSLVSRYSASRRDLLQVSAEVGRQIASSLCPARGAPQVEEGWPIRAVEAGLENLARWRGERWALPGHGVWPLLVDELPVPRATLVELAGKGALADPWILHTPAGATLSSRTGRRSALSRLGDPAKAASALADALIKTEGDAVDAERVAWLRIRSGEVAGAYVPVAHAALRAAREGRLTHAWRWLLFLDVLSNQSVTAGHLAFDLAAVQARVALGTRGGTPEASLLEACQGLAITPSQRQRAELLSAELQFRAGEVRPALVNALRQASPALSPEPVVAAEALTLATRCRLALGQQDEARQQIERARALLGEDLHPGLMIELADLEAQLLLARHDLQGLRSQARETLKLAERHKNIYGATQASLHLAVVLRYLGKRREAETYARAARELAEETGHLELLVRTGLIYASLLVERGDVLAARQALDTSMRHLQAVKLHHLLPRAWRIGLQIAALSGNADEVDSAFFWLDKLGAEDPETPAVRIRWWRSRGEVERALAVGPPAAQGYGHTLWLLERSRTALTYDRIAVASEDLEAALGEAHRWGFAELQIYAQLLEGILGSRSDHAWQSLLKRASRVLFVEVYLGSIALDATRLHRRGELEAARSRWRTLRARARELGYTPAIREANGWIEGQ